MSAPDPALSRREDLAALLNLAWPVMLSRLGTMTMNLTDAIFVGRYSARQLSFHALAGTPSSVATMVAVGLMTGVSVMTSRAIGEGRPEGAGAVLRRGMVYAAMVGSLLSAVLILGGPPGLRMAKLPDGLAAGATAPLIVFALSVVPITISVAGISWLEAINRPRVAMRMMILANLVNIAIDAVFVPGRFGVPALGALGGACATLVSRTVLMSAIYIYIFRMRDARAFGVFAPVLRDRATEREQRGVGYGAAVSNFFEMSAFSGMNIIAGWVGPTPLAAWTIVLSVLSVAFMAPSGIATATAVMTASAYGARDRQRLDRMGRLGLAVTLAYALLVGTAVFVVRVPVVGLFTSDSAAAALAVPALALTCLMLAPDCSQFVLAQVLRARADVWVPTATHFFSYIVLMAPLAYVLALPAGLGVNGVVLGSVVASVVSAGLLFIRLSVVTRRGL